MIDFDRFRQIAESGGIRVYFSQREGKWEGSWWNVNGTPFGGPLYRMHGASMGGYETREKIVRQLVGIVDGLAKQAKTPAGDEARAAIAELLR